MRYRITQIDVAKHESELLALQEVCLPKSNPLAPDQWGATHAYWWIMRDETGIIGFASLREAQSMRKTGYLSRAGVLPAHRGQGLQKRLIRAREKKARALGWTHLVSDTYDNPPSANNLIDCGYKTFKPRKPWAFATSVYWRKAL